MPRLARGFMDEMTAFRDPIAVKQPNERDRDATLPAYSVASGCGDAIEEHGIISLVSDIEDGSKDRDGSTKAYCSVNWQHGSNNGKAADDLIRGVSAAPDADVKRTTLSFPPFEQAVIIPQRRPGDCGRGFVRAYAPILAERGISQDVFLAFIESFERAVQASSIFTVVQISALVVGCIPSVIAKAVTLLVSSGAEVGRCVQVRTRHNTYLDKINEELFKPVGLYALLVKYKSDDQLGKTSQSVRMGISFGPSPSSSAQRPQEHVIAARMGGASDSSFKKGIRKLKIGSSTTYGTRGLPPSAELIYPEPTHRSGLGKNAFLTNLKDVRSYFADCHDRSAQRKFSATNGPSRLDVPEIMREPRRWTDHRRALREARSASTGLKSDAFDCTKDCLSRASGRTSQSSQLRSESESFSNRIRHKEEKDRQRRRKKGKSQRCRLIKKIACPGAVLDVFYLMIVNRPSEAELVRARAEMERQIR